MEAAGAAARVPLYRRLVDPFTDVQTLWEFENLFVLSGQTNGAWADLGAEFASLAAAAPGENTARALLERARAFSEFCKTFRAELDRVQRRLRTRAASAAADLKPQAAGAVTAAAQDCRAAPASSPQ